MMEAFVCKFEDKKSNLKVNSDISTPTMSSGKLKKKKKI